jgi:hypothetical protein
MRRTFIPDLSTSSINQICALLEYKNVLHYINALAFLGWMTHSFLHDWDILARLSPSDYLLCKRIIGKRCFFYKWESMQSVPHSLHYYLTVQLLLGYTEHPAIAFTSAQYHEFIHRLLPCMINSYLDLSLTWPILLSSLLMEVEENLKLTCLRFHGKDRNRQQLVFLRSDL